MVKKSVNGVNIIAVIHARGGSKRIPLKNIKPLNGKPLITYTIEAALKSPCLRRVIVSTDHPEIKKISLEAGAEVPFTRPKRLSTDCPSEWVTIHAVKFVEAQEKKKIDIAVTLQPTTPFCTSDDIDACIYKLLAYTSLDSVFSAKKIHERPEWMFHTKDIHVVPFVKGRVNGRRGVTQSLPTLVIPNGAVYATRRDPLIRESALITQKVGVHLMSLESSTEIDEPLHFRFAEFMAQDIALPT